MHLPQEQAVELGLAQQMRMVDALQAALQRQQQGRAVERIETHIGFVLVDGEYAYKLKKAVDLGFLDFTTLARRRHSCNEELRLNRRLAADLYLDAVPVTGSVDAPVIAGAGPVIDYAVKMRAFAQQGLWDRLAARGALQTAAVDDLVGQLQRFHQSAPAVDAHSPFGTPAQVRQPMLDNLAALRPLLDDEPQRSAFERLGGWEASEFAAIEALLQQRRRQGRVRECHGDLHLGNVVQIDGRCTVFDCIEFNDDFRHIDVMSDVAFMAMDLQAHGCIGLAQRFVNGYLERSGDYAGARVLRYYVVYRALVRAKVAALRAAQPGAQMPDRLAGVRPFIDLAQRCAQSGPGVLLITHGLPGSGKTRGTQELLQAVGAIRIRADVERKRLFGLDPLARSGSALHEGLYSASATAATYARLHELARPLLEDGNPVVLDATFGRRWQRDQARQLAAQLQLPLCILDFVLPMDLLRARVRERAAGGGDASEADLRVLEAQSRSAEPLADDEQAFVLACPAQDAADELELQRRWQGVGQGLLQQLQQQLQRPRPPADGEPAGNRPDGPGCRSVGVRAARGGSPERPA